MSDIEAIRLRHVPRDIGNECAWCHMESWPCDTFRVLDALDEAKAKAVQHWLRLMKAIEERDAARADADRLAEALRDTLPSDHIIDSADEYDLIECGYHKHVAATARAALTAHDAAQVSVHPVGPDDPGDAPNPAHGH